LPDDEGRMDSRIIPQQVEARVERAGELRDEEDVLTLVRIWLKSLNSTIVGKVGSALPYNLPMHTYTVSLRIQSRALDVAQIKRELGLAPTQTRAVGERRSAHTVWDEALWELEAFPEGRSDWDSLEAGLAALLKISVPHANVLQEYRKKYDVFIWCGHFSSSFDGGPHLSAEILKALGDFGVPLWLDTHFCNE
jgi:hypothetical protein